MIAQGPGIPAGQVNTGLVELRDVTTTILAAAGVEIPSHMDSRPLPGIGLTDEPARERIFGMLSDGWMNYDGRWKLARYASGDTTLFDLDNDPTEQVNLATDSAHSETMRRLDLELSQEIMESMQHAFHDRLAQSGDMSQDHGFGREGWRRPWPTQIGSLQE